MHNELFIIYLIIQVFIILCINWFIQVTSIPWNDEELSSETNLISDKLAKINSQGVLTINSQPNLNGVSSSDPALGWGAPNGYIYQKVILVHSITIMFWTQNFPLA